MMISLEEARRVYVARKILRFYGYTLGQIPDRRESEPLGQYLERLQRVYRMEPQSTTDILPGECIRIGGDN